MRAADVIDLGGNAVSALFGLRSVVDHTEGALHDVIYIGEVADHVTAVEDLDRLSLGDGRGEKHRRHVKYAPRV